MAALVLCLAATPAAAQGTDISNSFSDYNFVPAVRARIVMKHHTESSACCAQFADDHRFAQSSCTVSAAVNCHAQGRSLYYDFVAYNYENHTIPDVLLTLKTSGAVDAALYMYCNPAWFSATEGNSIPKPSNAIFKSGT